jgi:hypothetical protein
VGRFACSSLTVRDEVSLFSPYLPSNHFRSYEQARTSWIAIYQYTSLVDCDGDGNGDGYKRERQEPMQFLTLFVAGLDVGLPREALLASRKTDPNFRVQIFTLTTHSPHFRT